MTKDGKVVEFPISIMGLVGTFLLSLIKATVLVWGAITNWAYRVIHNSTEVVKAFSKVCCYKL